ncbi:MAG: hypothetical protein HY909_26105 [Deltaproteobacteria bacterium]|nr:hypothetical protein [Deltaproteobacteria bacterium]
MAEDWDSGVFPHGDITPLANNLWWVKSAQKGLPLPRNMAIYRLPDGGLVLHSVVCMDAARMAALEKLGAPKYMIVPNEGHRTDAPRYKARYPQLRVLCPSGARAKVEEIIKPDATCEDPTLGVSSFGVTWHAQDGTKPPSHELAYEVDIDGGKALILNDLLGNGPKLSGDFRAPMFNLLGSGGVLGVPRIVRWMFVEDKARVRAFLERMAEKPWKVITVSHGDPITEDCSGALRRAAARL